jgi:hypothetical protein
MVMVYLCFHMSLSLLCIMNYITVSPKTPTQTLCMLLQGSLPGGLSIEERPHEEGQVDPHAKPELTLTLQLTLPVSEQPEQVRLLITAAVSTVTFVIVYYVYFKLNFAPNIFSCHTIPQIICSYNIVMAIHYFTSVTNVRRNQL